MAPKQVTDILVRLGIEGFEGLEKIKSSFRELGKVSNLTGDQIQDVRAQILDFAKEAGNTQRVNKGLEEAFRGLLGEAERGSDVWKQLNADLSKLRQESRLTDREITALRDVIVKETEAHNQSSSSIREHIKSLQELRSQASLNGKIHQELGADIQKLTATLNNGSQANREHYKSLGQILAVKPDKVLRQWENYTRILQEGTASAEKLELAQRRLNQLSGAPRILERRRIAESAAITQDPEYLRRFGFAGASLPELPNTNAAYAQQIKELNQDLANLNRTSVEYLQTQMQLAGVQRQATEVTRGFAQALVMGLKTKTVENSTRNLQEAITALRAEMQQLDTSTAEGSRVYAENANNVRQLEGELKKLGDSYRHVADMATQAATAEQNAANARTRGNYFNRAAVRQQEQAFVELRERIQQGVAGTPLLLPAAGGTGGVIAPGAVMGGGARAAIGPGTEITFGAPSTRRPSVQANLPTAATGVAPAVGGRLAEAYDGIARSADRARRPLREILIEISRTQQASNGSVNSLQAQISAWTDLRNAVNASAPAFATATKNIQQLSRQQEALTGRGRITPGQAVQTAGAVISGGIFGGPEGFLGGLGGAALGASIPGLGIVGGAFAGSAAGAQIGMFRQQIAGTADYAAQIGKLQIALRGIIGNQDDYNKAIAAAASVTRDLNIPQAEATRGLTRLSAAVLGAGGNVNDSSFAFRAMSEAIKATGGNAEQVDGALLALTQVFSKGKVSAEELNQIAERLPGTFTLFAQATGKTGPELQKALEQGQVGLNDLMKFLTLVSSNYSATAQSIAASSQDAGARLTIAFDAMRLAVGNALQPIGAQLQDAFAAFITNITPALVAAAKGTSDLFAAIDKHKESIEIILKLSAAYAAATLALNAYKVAATALAGLQIASTFAATASSIKITGDFMQVAAVRTNLFTAALGTARLAVVGFAAAVAAPLVLTVAIVGGAAVLNWIQKLKSATDELKASQRERIGQAWLSGIGGRAAPSAVVNRETSRQLQRVSDLEQDLQQTRKAIKNLKGKTDNLLSSEMSVVAQAELARQQEREKALRNQVYNARRNAEVGLAEITRRQTAPVRSGSQFTNFGAPVLRDGGSGRSGAAAAKAAAREAASDLKEQLKLQREIQALSLEAQRPIIEAKQRSARLEREIAAAAERGDQVATFKLERTKLDAEFSGKIAEIRNKERKELQASADNQDQTNRKLRDQLTIARSMNELREAAVDQQEKITDLEERAARARASQTRDLTATVADRQRELGLISREDYNRILLQRERERLNREFGMAPEATRGQALDLYRQQIDPTATETVRGEIVKLEDEMRRLTDAGGMVVNAASEIGNAFGNSFRGIIDGSMSAQQALSGFFKNVANAFLEMAAQIIAKWLAMAALNAVLKLFPGGGAAAAVSPTAQGGDVWGAVGRLFGENAMGNAYSKNGIVPFAYGGVVNRPTLFPFAKGIGLMGEAGPEAILPLRRGSDGRLGVSSSGGGSTVVNVSVDASGTAVEGNGPGAKQMGRIIGAAVQAEIVKMQRPGGLLANTR